MSVVSRVLRSKEKLFLDLMVALLPLLTKKTSTMAMNFDYLRNERTQSTNIEKFPNKHVCFSLKPNQKENKINTKKNH